MFGDRGRVRWLLELVEIENREGRGFFFDGKLLELPRGGEKNEIHSLTLLGWARGRVDLSVR
jgi:hypothetical protein